ncbi:isoleucine--tRNA ligase, mitochondrial isoform X1 [Macrobrachium rosenbergii]|uniref:isoleucine--tRNA ligase, mitochondrial isoform X1 n=1 Tax=Macrobrachium rosenbergii TaxID=79674 RepID=UPI0034D45403
MAVIQWVKLCRPKVKAQVQVHGISQCKQPQRNYFASVVRLCENKELQKKYKNTVLLPVTTFPLHIEGHRRVENERYVQKAAEFSSLYAWQRQQSRDLEYVLHDGPPYANGQPHIGHAVNKILKDITLRHKLLRGYKIHYVPGWDCHGLPIELKATEKEKKTKGKKKLPTKDPLAVRATAKSFAEAAILTQKLAFERWGVMADWNNVYRTFDPEYVYKQLHLFADLYEKGYIYQSYKPVYFSPSSRTSLAEAELEYVPDHCSPSLYVALLASNLPSAIQEILNENGNPNVYLAIWTTTPWTLPANEAICFSVDEQYSLIRLTVNQQTVYVIWAKELLKELQQFASDLTELCCIKGSLLADVTYRHPLSERQCRCLPGEHVTVTKGTGLVHTAPAHGHEDFLVALQHKILVECKINQQGCYEADFGQELEGKNVLIDANEAVTELLSKPDGHGGPSIILNQGTFIHSYPYDWRTKKPVIIRASKQWFIDTDELKDKALEALKEVQIYPTDIQSGMEGMLKRRPYWCISRQRIWGCPIPVFYDATSDEPVTSREIIEHIVNLMKEKGADIWWELSEEELLPPTLVKQYQVEGKKLPRKGSDILDIWFDSGSSWYSVLGSPSADLYLEGIDQFTGWFQSSLLTSVAITGKAPYRNLYVHGFTLDEEGKKMSKSLGNVVDPHVITDGGKNHQKDPVYGADVLRWWVAGHVTNTSMVKVGKNILDSCSKQVQKVRLTLRFLLSALGDYQPSQHSLPVSALRPVDQYMLHLLHNHTEKVWENYNQFYYHKIVSSSVAFINSDVSSFYINLVRDRLYCESRWSPKRISALVVLQNLLNHLLFTLGPILPHLAEEITLHHPVKKGSRVFHQQTSGAPNAWKQPHLASIVEECLNIKKEIYHQHPDMNPFSMELHITAGGKSLNSLKVMQTSEDSQDSGLCELMQAARVVLLEDANEGFSFQICVPENSKCLRCRKVTARPKEDLCIRCQDVISSGW